MPERLPCPIHWHARSTGARSTGALDQHRMAALFAAAPFERQGRKFQK
jgi:hypothetical protein